MRLRSNSTYGLLFAVPILAICASVGAQVTKTKEGYLLRVNYPKGRVIRFQTTNSVSGLTGTPSSAMKFSTPITMTVLDVQRDKSKIKLRLGALKLGATIIQPEKTATVWLDNRNQADSGEAQSVGAQLPLKPIRPGATWRASIPLTMGMGSSPTEMQATYTFAGIRLTGPQPLAVISYRVSGVANGKGTMTLLVKDGTLFSNETHLAMSVGDQASVSVNSVMKRQ